MSDEKSVFTKKNDYLNVLLNLAPLKKGGGQNVGLNFLQSLGKIDNKNLHFIFVVAANSEIHKFIEKNEGNRIVIMPVNPFLRIMKEFLYGNSILRKFNIDIIYSYFGTGLFPKSVPQIGGCADSNLFFPEIDFWEEYSGIKKWFHWLVDKYRVWGLRRMHAVVFENELMQERCSKMFDIPKTIFIRPSINLSLQDAPCELPSNAVSARSKGLFFCGWQRNKNFMIIPGLAARLKKANIDFHFIITAPPDNSADHRAFTQLIATYNCGDMISMVGPIKKSEISSLYEQIDFVFLLSKLESFSNNIIEAWHFKKPLIIADEPWSRSICKKAAIYVSRNDPNDITVKVIALIQNEMEKQKIIREGMKILDEYPTIEQRTRQEIDYLKSIYSNG